MRFKLIIGFFALFITSITFAQQSRFTGVIKDRAGDKPVAGASVALLRQLDCTLVATTLSGHVGEFYFY